MYSYLLMSIGTLLSDAISSIPGNTEFDQNIEFSLVFGILGGETWYVAAEVMFVVSCMIQCSTGIVQCAHTLDGIIARYSHIIVNLRTL